MKKSQFTQIIPHVHLAAQSAHFNDGLAQEVVRFAGQLLPQPGLEIIVLVPDADFDAIWRVVAFTVAAENNVSLNSNQCRGEKKQKNSTCFWHFPHFRPSEQKGYSFPHFRPSEQKGYPFPHFRPSEQKGYPFPHFRPSEQKGYPFSYFRPSEQKGYPFSYFRPSEQKGYPFFHFRPSEQQDIAYK